MSDRLGRDGRGRCPMCGVEVRGEPLTLASYWHPVEQCREVMHGRIAALTKRVASLEERLRAATSPFTSPSGDTGAR